jgi:long-chain alkane monooxygenase
LPPDSVSSVSCEVRQRTPNLEDGAVQRDKARGIFADPAKPHPIRHKGRYFETPGVHLCEPSPQRTPLLFRAGSSPRGKAICW